MVIAKLMQKALLSESCTRSRLLLLRTLLRIERILEH
jgi:hypothetical protein